MTGVRQDERDTGGLPGARTERDASGLDPADPTSAVTPVTPVTPVNRSPRVHRAEEADRKTICRLLDVAFEQDPVSRWVFPDAARRAVAHPRFFEIVLDAAWRDGFVDITEDGAAVALWLSVPAEVPETASSTPEAADTAEGDDMGQRIQAVDPGNERPEIVGRLTRARHPHDRAHRYLMFIGVDPERQGDRLGSALLAPALHACDRDRVPAYLEASSERSRALYTRLGFDVIDEPVELPRGPLLWPMWREPRAAPADR
ncbi:GNAT family N-acetyltransferase [Streptomyces sp. H27-D2]|uniref:GNAT family N-acetyltransferase n=1 Tax=Streptomyces sp. H27-D2 TaxID=3046304 RepID=UPI002DBC6ED8|nr:GNAT family N-acetyltransferase [Streptomyces sp. H27-D2]MEC4020627.1 GNAT family N-acetyltransferase [Streptomyces sp. H27-D2]